MAAAYDRSSMRRSRLLSCTVVLAALDGLLGACVGDDLDPRSTTEDGGAEGSTGSVDGAFVDGSASMDASPEATDDAAADATSDAADAAVDAPAPECDPAKPFGAAAAVPGLPTDAIGLRLYDDERVVYFFRTSTTTLFTASRASRSDAFSNITVVPMPTPDAGLDNFPTLDQSLLSIYFGSSRSGSIAIWGSTRASVVTEFSAPVMIANVNAAPSGRPSVTADGEELFFQSTVGADINVVVAKKNAGGFAAPVDVLADPIISDVAPAISPDGLTLYFGSVRASEPAQQANFDVWVTRRATRQSAFGAPKIESSASSADIDLPTWGSNDGCRLYVSSQSTSRVFVRPL